MDKQDFYKQLIHRYVTNQATEEELEAFFHLMESGDMDAELEAYMSQEAAQMAAEETAPVKVRRLWPRIAVAASILLLLSAGGYFWLNKSNQTDNSPLTAHQDIAPGRDQATLTLADGRKIILTKGLSGKLAEQGHTTIQVDSAAIAYRAPSPLEKAGDEVVQYNTLTTKRGEASPYPLVLPDGSKVWLNAASSVTFPTAFVGKTREVTVKGEAYFEVAHNAKQPFSVKTGNQLIEDIGTSFDVNAYPDEPAAKTTLVEGSVRINHQTILKPGQQSAVEGNNVAVNPVDVRDIVAWKNGNFRFTKEQLGLILRQAARWYDVDIAYENEALKTKTFGVITTRFAKVSQLLHVLELTGEVRFQIEGRKITVLNK